MVGIVALGEEKGQHKEGCAAIASSYSFITIVIIIEFSYMIIISKEITNTH